MEEVKTDEVIVLPSDEELDAKLCRIDDPDCEACQ